MNSKKKSKLNKIFSFRYFFYDFVKYTGAIPMYLFLRPCRKYINKKSCKNLKTGFLLSANHQGFLDPIIMLFSFPFRRAFFIAMERMFDTPLKNWFFKRMHCIKVDRNNVGLDTIRDTGAELQNGKIVCIFPEGKIGHETDMETFKAGAAMMSILNDVPIVPIYIEKREKIFRTTKIIIGEPIYPKDVVGDSQSLKAMEKLNKVLYEKEHELYEYYEKNYSRKGGKELS